MDLQKLDLKNFTQILLKHKYLLILLLIVLTAFWFRSFPARYGELQALDPFYLYRMSEYVVNNNFQLPEIDMLRYYPYGGHPQRESFMPYYFPALVYVLGGGWGMYYFHYAIIFPAAMGALAVLIMFFLAKELFGIKAGLMASFILAVLPAFITRTSAGFFEKEPISGVFSILTIYLLFKAYKNADWRYSILSGISLFLLMQTWGGSTYFVMIIGIFLILLLLANRNPSVLMKSFIPMLGLGISLNYLLPYNEYTITSSSALISFLGIALLLIRFGVERYKLVEKEKLPFIVPSLFALTIVFVLIGSMFSDFMYSILERLYTYSTLQLSVAISTVAESQPGSWNAILSSTSAHYSANVLPQIYGLIPYLAAWPFAFFGMFLIIYMFLIRVVVPIFSDKKPKAFDWLVFFPIIWFLSSIWGALGFIRLSFIIGPPFALLAGFFIAWFFNKTNSLNINKIKIASKETNVIAILVAIFIVFFVIANYANGYVYSQALGPSICFHNNKNILIDGQRCLDYDGENYTHKEGQPWYDAMKFLRENTTEDTAVLSWWDFGYWFETRGNRAAPSDGGGGPRYETAVWFTTEKWEDNAWPYDRNVTYILMDYTLPGKYGAISKIASNGEQVVGIMQFQNSGITPQGNKTIYEFKAGPYELWLPMGQNGNIVGNPLFLISQNGVYVQRTKIKNICTVNGIIEIPTDEHINGCIALTDIGVFYVPKEAERTIFSKLMFMEGWDTPVKKIFDNDLIKIYEIVG